MNAYACMQPSLIQVLDADFFCQYWIQQTWEILVLMVTAYIFTDLKQKEFFLFNTEKIGNQLKLCNTLSCIQLYFKNLGLHPKKYFLLPWS